MDKANKVCYISDNEQGTIQEIHYGLLSDFTAELKEIYNKQSQPAVEGITDISFDFGTLYWVSNKEDEEGGLFSGGSDGSESTSLFSGAEDFLSGKKEFSRILAVGTSLFYTMSDSYLYKFDGSESTKFASGFSSATSIARSGD